KKLSETALRTIAKNWAMGRVLLEHRKSNATPAPDGNNFNEREELAIKLIDLFPGCVTETTLVKVFGLHYSQAGQIVDRLCKRDVLEKKSGKGMPLQLTKAGESVAKEIELERGRRFAYLANVLSDTEIKQYEAITEHLYEAARREVEERVFDGKVPQRVRSRPD